MDNGEHMQQGASKGILEPTTNHVRFIACREVADKTMALYFERPADFSFKAGQFIDLMLLDPPETDSAGNTRALTIASAPSENCLMVVTRVRDSAFKRVLMNMPLQTMVNIEGPYGHLTLPEQAARPLVFLAGGIGIAPFRSMLIDAAANQRTHRFTLLYANRRLEDAPFFHELEDLQGTLSNYTFVGTMTQPAQARDPWLGETGYVDQAMLMRHVPGIDSPIYYIVGSSAMVSGCRSMLRKAGVRDHDIRTEEFVGY
ncbi:ferredoxin--NADP reductase [Nitrospira sp. M1]